jgi:hypothetical protein
LAIGGPTLRRQRRASAWELSRLRSFTNRAATAARTLDIRQGILTSVDDGPQNEAREHRSRARSLHLPHRYSQLPNDYYSDDKMAVETRLRIPSPPDGVASRKERVLTSEYRIPSPPASRRASRPWPSLMQRVPSPSPIIRRRSRPPPFPRIPSPPPFNRQRGGNGAQSSLPPAIIVSADHDRLPRPSTPPYVRDRNEYLSLSDRDVSSERDRAQGLKRWNSEKPSRLRAASDTDNRAT